MNEKSENCEGSPCLSEDAADVFELISKINKKYEKLQRKNIQELNLTPTQHLILRELWTADERPFKELADTCDCTRSTITGVVDTMEDHKLVTREKNPKDRRSTLVKLTEKGKKLKNATPPIESIVNGCCPEINQEEIETLGKLLLKLLNSLKL
ncbi:MAG: MarR family winged helix-turn-helix transcriptional regulator [Candidatus Hermodarchaeota archaeon]